MVFLWGYTHFVFVKDPENCIPDIGQLQSDIIIQIEVYHNSTTVWKQRNKAVTRLIILNEIAKCNASNIMNTEGGEYVCASEDINSLYARLFLVPVTQCSVSNYSRCNHVNHNIVKEVTVNVNQISKPLFYIMGKSGEKILLQKCVRVCVWGGTWVGDVCVCVCVYMCGFGLKCLKDFNVATCTNQN